MYFFLQWLTDVSSSGHFCISPFLFQKFFFFVFNIFFDSLFIKNCFYMMENFDSFFKAIRSSLGANHLSSSASIFTKSSVLICPITTPYFRTRFFHFLLHMLVTVFSLISAGPQINAAVYEAPHWFTIG